MSDLVGKNIGEYQLSEIVDDAGNATVYRGFQPSTGHYVAIKVLKPDVAGKPTLVQSFLQYAGLATEMQHSNILPVLASAQEHGHTYLVTPYQENRSVNEQVSAYADPHQALGLMNGLVDGLEYIYTRGYIHGNLRPTNTLLSAQNQPLLSDFGVSFQKGQTPSAYNSPEQIQGSVVDQRTDVYALGVLLYFLLTGQAPSPGATVNLRAIRPDVPPSVEQVLLKAIAQNPDQRYQSPRTLLNALANALQVNVSQPAAQAAQPAAQKSSNWMGIAVGVILAAFICLCAIVVIPRAIDYFNADSGAPAEPAEPPEPVIPTEAPPEPEIPTEPPEVEDPPAEEPPSAEQLPEDGSGSTQICGSLGFAGGLILMGGVISFRRKKKPESI